jgi:hypothetical protein
VTIWLIAPLAWEAVPAKRTVNGGSGSASFVLSYRGGPSNGNTNLTANLNDGRGIVLKELGPLLPDSSTTLPGLPLAADTLYAVPLKAQAAVGEPVPLAVLTGATAAPFYNAVIGLTVAGDGEVVPGSVNAGAPGGMAQDQDGIWALVGASGFPLDPNGTDGFLRFNDIGNGQRRWDFVLTPVGGGPASGAAGAIVNCLFSFSEPGVKTFGFQDISGVKRTYYSDGTTEYSWGVLDGSAGSVPNSVEIN